MKKKFKLFILGILFLLFLGNNNEMKLMIDSINMPKNADSNITTHSNIIVHDKTFIILNWNISDVVYDIDALITIQINSNLKYSGGFSNSLEYNLSLNEGNYIVVFTYNDGFGNIDIDTFEIFNNFSPLLQISHSQTSIIASNHEIISWHILDNSLQHSYFSLYLDNEFLYSIESLNDMSYTFYNLSLGNHLLRFHFYDGFGKNCSEEFTLISNDLPLIESNFSENFIDLNFWSQINYTITDTIHFNPTYKLKIDGIIVSNGNLFTNTLSYTFPSLEQGKYVLIVEINDGQGGVSTLSHILISDKSNFITQYSSFTLTESDDFNSIIHFSIKNNIMNEGFYELYIDNLLYLGKTIYYGSIDVNVSSLSFERHDLLIIAQSVANIVDYCYFPLIPNEKPMCLSIFNQTVINTSSFSLTWIFFDESITEGSNLKILINGTEYQTILYQGNLTFTVNFTDFTDGDYSIIAIFNDGYSEVVENHINITISIIDKKSINIGMIIGISIGSVVIVGVGIAIGLTIKKRRQK